MVKNPFTPGLPIDPKQFVGRNEEIQTFVKSLEQSFYGNPQNLAIMGDRGIGKSSLLKKFESIAREQNCLVVRRDVDASVDSLQMLAYCILRFLREEGKRYFSKSKKAQSIVSGFFQRYKISVSISGFGGSVEKTLPIAIQEELYDEMAKIAKNVQKQVRTAVIMLDETEHLQNIEGAWGFLRSVFTRLVEDGNHFMVVICGKLGLFSNIKEIFSPMERFFYPREIGLLTPEETMEAFEKPMIANGRTVSEQAKKLVVKYTEGHPFIIQVFGYCLFESEERHIDETLFQKQLPRVLERLKVQVFRDRLSSASPREKDILRFMASSEKEIFKSADIMKPLKTKDASYVRNLLKRLVEKDCLRKISPGNYTFFHKLFKIYVRGESQSNNS